MGTIRYTEPDPDGESHGLHDHEGYVGQVWDDESLHGGGDVTEVDRRTVAWRAACGCGWLGETVLPRPEGASAWPEWEDVPELEREWTAHTDPVLDALAREHGVVSAEEVTEALAPVRAAAEQAGALVATALRACDELERAGAGGDELGEIRRHLVDAGRAIGRAEVLSYPIRQVVGPLVLERIESQETTGWARWEVRDQAGASLGRVVEDHEWMGHTYGPVSFTVTHNPSGASFGALWRTEGHETPRRALGALVEHLQRRPEAQPS